MESQWKLRNLFQKLIDTRMAKWYDRFSQVNIPVRGADFKSKLSEVSRNRRTQPKGKAAEGDSSGMDLPDPALKKRRVVITGVVES